MQVICADTRNVHHLLWFSSHNLFSFIVFAFHLFHLHNNINACPHTVRYRLMANFISRVLLSLSGVCVCAQQPMDFSLCSLPFQFSLKWVFFAFTLEPMQTSCFIVLSKGGLRISMGREVHGRTQACTHSHVYEKWFCIVCVYRLAFMFSASLLIISIKK